MHTPNFVALTVAALATWRISASLYYGKEFHDLRYRAGAYNTDAHGEADTWPGGQFACFWCVSFWVAWPVALVAWLWWPALVPFALSGAAILLSGGGRIIWREMVDG